MSNVGFNEVVDYANTTLGTAREVIANGGISGTGVVVLGPSAPGAYITAENGDLLDTENADNLTTEQ